MKRAGTHSSPETAHELAPERDPADGSQASIEEEGLPVSNALESAAPGLGTPITEVLRLWNDLEPGRYFRAVQDGRPELRLVFGGHNWFDSPEEPSRDLLKEFAAAFDATAQRQWPVELHFLADGTSTARVSISPERSFTSAGVEYLGAFVRATVHALSSRLERDPAGPAAFWGVTFTGLPGVRGYQLPRRTLPVEDLRVWARLEPHRFDQGAAVFSSPIFRGSGSNVLAPVTRAMHYLQYAPAAAVFESAALHGWDVCLRSVVAQPDLVYYECQVTQPDGRTAEGRHVTPGPAAVKGYLQALVLASDGAISTVPKPTDRFPGEVVVVQTGTWCEFPAGKPNEYAKLVGEFAVFKDSIESVPHELPKDFRVLDRDPTVAEVEASVAAGVLPAPWP